MNVSSFLSSVRRVLIAAAVFAVPSLMHLTVQAENWPQWRGPTGMGISTEKNLPTKWSASENVVWKTRLPGPGNSTPIVWGDRVFLTQAKGPNGSVRTLMCLDRKTGKELWTRSVTHGGEESTHKTNPQCSASPVTDGERVIVSYASAGVYCYDFEGKELWSRDLGKQEHIWGNGASPAIWENLCLLNFGPGPNTFLIAMDKRTGRTVWKNDEPGGRSGKEPRDGKSGRAVWIGSWTTPVLNASADRPEMLMTYPHRMYAFDPRTGKEYWTCGGINPLVYTSPIYDDGIAVGMGGFQGDAIAVRLGGQGDVTGSHRLWRNERTAQRIGSGVIHEGHIYIVNDPGIAECIDLKTGEKRWRERLRGPGPTSQNWSSTVLADGNVYAVNQGGDAFVFKASPKFEVLGINSLGEKVIGSMAVSRGNLFIRGHRHLWCIGR